MPALRSIARLPWEATKPRIDLGVNPPDPVGRTPRVLTPLVRSAHKATRDKLV
jgi:hypothetical protein